MNTYTRFRQLGQSVAGLGDGGFVVIWTSQDGQDGSGYGVYGQRYSHEGKKVGAEFRVNTHTAGHQGYNSSVAALSKEGFVATWDSDGQDGSRTGVYGQLYSP